MQLEFAPYGWLGPEWAGLYPDDLPPEWRLEYYSNDFDSIIVPAESWRHASIDQALGWLQETPDSLRFYWEIEDADGAARLLELLSKADTNTKRIAGWLFRDTPKLEFALIQALTSVLPGAAYGESPLPIVKAEQFAAEGITLCWQENSALNCSGRGLRIFQIHRSPVEFRKLRQIIDEQSASGTDKLLLMLKPEATTATLLRELDTFITLLNG